MKYCVNFERVISAIINVKDIEIDDKTVSFYNADPIIMGFAKIFSDIVDMNDRAKIVEKYEYQIARITRTLCQYIGDVIGCDWCHRFNAPDMYTTIVYNLLYMGIAPTPSLFNILNTGSGILSEYPFSAGEKAMLMMAKNNPDYYKTVNEDFFDNYVVFKNLICADELNTLLNISLPTTLTKWLTRYDWSPADCEYIFSHFDEFIDMYETEVCGDD